MLILCSFHKHSFYWIKWLHSFTIITTQWNLVNFFNNYIMFLTSKSLLWFLILIFLFLLYFHGCCLLTSCMFLISMQQILPSFFHLLHFSLIKVFFQHPLQYLCIYLLFLCRLYSYLYPFNIILLFLHIFFPRDHTKTHESLFYLLPILINLNRLIYSWVSVFFPFLLLIIYLKNCVVW